MLEPEKIEGAFEFWGFNKLGESGGQMFGDCPFCGKPKFYINQKSALWDCKRCGLSGNYLNFLKKISDRNREEIDDDKLLALAKDRGLPRAAFKDCEIGVYGRKYSFPVYNEEGRLQDLRSYTIGKGLRGAAGCNVGLWGIQNLAKREVRMAPVYVCEGEWDGIALSWLLRSLAKPGVVVAVPGANTFKDNWLSFFEKREVYLCYDNDEPGEEGELKAFKKLSNIAKFSKCLHWPSKLSSGFDIRDLIRFEAVQKNLPKRTFRKLHEMFEDSPRQNNDDKGSLNVSEKREGGEPEQIKIEKVFERFQKWLFLKNTDGIEMMLATVIANKIQGDPIWMFLVAPPGSAKTEIIQSLNQCGTVYACSSLTPHSLISGAGWSGGSDPSLIPKLNRKVLAIKDFTTIMEMRDNERDEIFGILRDSYDGSCVKVFGNGVKRSYESKFGIIAGVTPVIYHLDAQSQSLGERFLKFSIEANLKHVSEDEIIERAIGNINRETSMRSELAEVVGKFVDRKYYELGDVENLPLIPAEIGKQIITLVKFGSRMRGTVSRDRYQTEMINARPSSEIGSRLGKQLAKLAQSLAIVNGRKEVNQHDYELVKKCMLDTLSQKIEDVVRCLYELCPTENDSVSTRQVSAYTKYPQSTVSRTLADLFMLEIARRIGKVNKYEWTLTEYVRRGIRQATIYDGLQEVKQRKELPKGMVKIRRRVRI